MTARIPFLVPLITPGMLGVYQAARVVARPRRWQQVFAPSGSAPTTADQSEFRHISQESLVSSRPGVRSPVLDICSAPSTRLSRDPRRLLVWRLSVRWHV